MGRQQKQHAVMTSRKRKKKGRPSLLDLKRRSLRLQSQQNPNPSSPTPTKSAPGNPKSKSNPTSRRATRRNPDPDPDPNPTSSSSDNDDEFSGRKKKLKSVLAGDEEERNNSSKATNEDIKEEEDASESVPPVAVEVASTTMPPLPDKKLLLFILDRLQKKDTYGVFSEPVDPEELPDYFEIIEHPMDFGTIREKLEKGEFKNLEQFENDVFLVSSNAMSYNGEDTIYYRQARSIEELAKKNFENLRQASNAEEQEQKILIRRGRPPKTKNIVGKPAENGSSDVSPEKMLANSDNSNVRSNPNHEISRKGLTGDKSGKTEVSTRNSYGARQSQAFGLLNDKKSENIGHYSGSWKYGKKPMTSDESHRKTYKQSQVSSCTNEHPMTALDGEKKVLVPVGFQLEYAYARSLARFAAKLGPIGWDIAAQKIRRVLPPGTKFGPGWVIDGEPSQESQQPLASTHHPSSQLNVSSCTSASQRKGDELRQRSEPFSNEEAIGEGSISNQPIASTSAEAEKSSIVASRVSDNGSMVSVSCNSAATIGASSLFLPNLRPEACPSKNGFSHSSISAQEVAKGLLSFDVQMTNAQLLQMVSGMNGSMNGNINGQHLDIERVKAALNSNSVNTGNPLPDTDHKQCSKSPSLDVRVQSSESSASGAVVDLKQPDLALQL